MSNVNLLASMEMLQESDRHMIRKHLKAIAWEINKLHIKLNNLQDGSQSEDISDAAWEIQQAIGDCKNEDHDALARRLS